MQSALWPFWGRGFSGDGARLGRSNPPPTVSRPVPPCPSTAECFELPPSDPCDNSIIDFAASPRTVSEAAPVSDMAFLGTVESVSPAKWNSTDGQDWQARWVEWIRDPENQKLMSAGRAATEPGPTWCGM